MYDYSDSFAKCLYIKTMVIRNDAGGNDGIVTV